MTPLPNRPFTMSIVILASALRKFIEKQSYDRALVERERNLAALGLHFSAADFSSPVCVLQTGEGRVGASSSPK